MTEDVVWEVLLLGLVNMTIGAADDVWSGLKLVIHSQREPQMVGVGGGITS